MLKEFYNIVLSISNNLTSHMVDYGVGTFNTGTEHFLKVFIINSQFQTLRIKNLGAKNKKLNNSGIEIPW